MSHSYRPYYRRNLPHIQPAGVTLFITFRLHNSLPLNVIRQIRDEETERIKALDRLPPAERSAAVYREQKRTFARYDAALDTATDSPWWLSDPVVADALHYRDGRTYVLDCFCIMSNHVHLLITPLSGADGTPQPLQAIMQSLKRHTAHHANRYLNRSGPFWQHESYDHIVRDEPELNRIRTYILYNPVKAGLVESWEQWPYTYSAYREI